MEFIYIPSNKMTESVTLPTCIWEMSVSTGVRIILANILHCSTAMLSLLISPWSYALLHRPPVVQLLETFLAFYGAWRLITAFKKALQWPLSWATTMQSLPSHPMSLRSLTCNLYILIQLHKLFWCTHLRHSKFIRCTNVQQCTQLFHMFPIIWEVHKLPSSSD